MKMYCPLPASTKPVARVPSASFVWRTAQYTLCNHGNYHYRHFCTGGQKIERFRIPVYAFGSRSLVWILSAGRPVQWDCTSRRRTYDSENNGLRLDRLNGLETL